MNPEIQQVIDAQMQKLPDAVRFAIADVGIRPRLQSIATRNNLRVDQAGIVETEAMLVMLGLEHPDKFVENLMKHGSMERATATAVAESLNQEVFREIRHLLIEMHEKEEETEKLLELMREHAHPEPSAEPQASEATPEAAPSGISRTLESDQARAKLQHPFRLPAEKVVVSDKMPQGSNQSSKYSSPDPYRETTE